MFLPIINYSDGYGFTYGGLISAKDTLAWATHLGAADVGRHAPGGAEIDRTFKSGPLTRAESSIAIWQRENPRFDIADQRVS